MNKEDYASLEVAKLLEEKGFNEPCDSRHIVYEDGKYKFERYKTFDIQKDIGIVKTKDGCFYDSYLAPTLYDAQKWLREKGIHIQPEFMFDGELWGCRILDMTEESAFGQCEGIKNPCKSYEEALNEGFLEALKLI